MDKTVKRKWRIIVIGFLAAVAVLSVIYGIPEYKKHMQQKQFAEQMDLGNRYLLELDYEAAVVAFGKAIEIDPRQAESYLKMAEAYVGMEDYKNAVLSLEKGYEFTGDERINEQRKHYMFYRDYLSYMKEIISVVSTQEIDDNKIWQLLEDTNYIDFFEAAGSDKVFYPDKNGASLGFYQSRNRMYLFYGNLENGIRRGIGSLYYITDATVDGVKGKKYIKYEGQWQNDIPDGEGILSELDNVRFRKVIVQGVFAEGLENGEMTRVYEQDGERRTFHYVMKNGIADIIDTQSWIDGRTQTSKTRNISAYAEENQDSWIWLQGKHGIWPFMQESGETNRSSMSW